jgi:hypothetical protein
MKNEDEIIIADRWQITKIIGSGSFGDIFLGADTSINPNSDEGNI